MDPQTHWLKNELKEYVYDNFSSTTVKNSDLFIQKNLLGYYENFLNDKVQNSFQIFTPILIPYLVHFYQIYSIGKLDIIFEKFLLKIILFFFQK